ncbi:hypothetical protein ACFFX1_10090 [Dactylosporangium sucinum]|uniref:Uncharacterized protein n=1 Tax=Dactylosporangium sucinum TaxID=1424081 RepID=A0A917X5Z3_9ACTN|nr:hypothetical protein [Dactylosporangium sucinum]GGM74265.1 hypothetical protein GCM10007977_089740 [Dactylosporangium sucinum]
MTVKGWFGAALMFAGAAFALGFFFVPPQVLIPELTRDPQLRLFPEGIVGMWAAAVGLALLIGDLRRTRR